MDGVPHYQTQGDANDTPDPDLAHPAAVIGEVTATLPLLGRLYHAVATFWGRMVLIVVPVMLLAFRELSELFKSARGMREQSQAA